MDHASPIKNILYHFPGFLFAVTAPAYIYVAYPDLHIYVSPDSIWRSTLICAVGYIFLGLIFFVLFRDHLTAGLISTCLILGIIYPRYPFLFIIGVILVTTILLALVQKRFDLVHAFLASIAVGAIIAAYIGADSIRVRHTLGSFQPRSFAEPLKIESLSPSTGVRPDIYYIILDAYGGETMLKELHAFDNSAFTSALRERGFTIHPGSKSNYLRTIHSLSSSLNMQYLDSVSQEMGNSLLWWPLKKTFSDNELQGFLKKQGYRTIVVASGWDFTTITDADTFIQPYPIILNDFEEFFVSNTNLLLFQPLGNEVVSFPSYDTHRYTVLSAFEKLKNLPFTESPKFVFVHIISPHPPFVFEENGGPATPDYPFTMADNRYLISPPSKYEEGYLKQLSFINTQVLQVVDAILANSDHLPVIVIQGDHGPGNFIDAQSASPPCFYERFSILNAYYIPDMESSAIPEDITPVNTFRLILNHYFSTDLELLPNRQYFSKVETIHKFEDVSNRTGDACMFPGDRP